MSALGVLAGQARNFQSINTASFSFFEESLNRTLLISEGYPRLNAKQSSENVLHSLVTLTEKNHALFLSHFIVQLIELIE